MTTIVQTQTQTAEELEAALHEGAAPISDEALELVARYRELRKQKAALDAEQEAIKELILGEMFEKGVNKLTRNGVTEVEEIPTKRKVIDEKGLAEDFGADVIANYISYKDGTRFDAKK